MCTASGQMSNLPLYFVHLFLEQAVFLSALKGDRPEFARHIAQVCNNICDEEVSQQ